MEGLGAKFSTRGSLQGNCDIQRTPKWNTMLPTQEHWVFAHLCWQGHSYMSRKSDLRDFFFLFQLDLIALTVVSTVVSYNWDVDRLSKWEEGIAAWVESLSLQGKHPFSMTSTHPSSILSPPFFFVVPARWNKGKQEAGPLQRNGSPVLPALPEYPRVMSLFLALIPMLIRGHTHLCREPERPIVLLSK